MELLKKLTQAKAPSGNEAAVREIIKSELEGFADEMFTDNLGSLIVHKKGGGKKLMLCAHTDEVGVLATFIEDNGFLRFAAVGGIPLYSSLYQSVEFLNGVRGVIGYEEKINIKTELAISKMYIDIGAKNAEEAQKLVSIGDCAVFRGDFYQNGSKIFSKALDDRVGVYVLINVLKSVKDVKNDLYFVFSVQEELGMRGARAAANEIAPDIALAVDVTDTGDTPNCRRMAVKLGGGACIKFMDTSIITHKTVNDALKAAARTAGVSVQNEVLTVGGTDAGAIHTSGAGVMTGAISVPTRYIHTPRECVDAGDVRAAEAVIGEFVNIKF